MGLETLMRVAQVLIAVAMIAIILIQRGAGAAAGSGFGAGASGTVFGSRGSGSFLTRTTGILAACFFVLTMVMGVVASRNADLSNQVDLGVMSEVAEQIEQQGEEVPALPGFSAAEPGDDVPALPDVGAAADDGDVPALPDEPAPDEAGG